MPHETLQLKKGIIGRGGSLVGCPFLGGLRSEWMKSGHGGRGGSKKAKNGWTSFVHGPTRLPKVVLYIN